MTSHRNDNDPTPHPTTTTAASTVADGPAGGVGTVYARALRKSFGDRVVLDRIDLDVRCVEIVCLIGPSGSGKSTLLRCVDGLEEIDRGVLRVNGEDLGFREEAQVYHAL